MDDQEYSLIEHLRDLRKALWRAVIGLTVCSAICFIFSDQILYALRLPMQESLGNSKFVVLAPHEYFFTKIKASMVAGIFLASPWILYQLWLFIAPGLYRREKKYVMSFVWAGTFFFVAGGVFSYFIVFPPMFRFFMEGLPPSIEGAYSVGMLFGFATNMLLAFGLVFEAPVVVFLLALMGVAEVETLVRFRRYVVVFSFVIGALLTPPDPVTQVFLAVPLIVLYELGLLTAKFVMRRKRQLEVSAEA